MPDNRRVESWGRYPHIEQRVRPLPGRDGGFPLEPGELGLPFGLGRSYGDSCLNEGGVVVTTSCLDRIIDLDVPGRRVRVEGGVSLAALLQHIVPLGLFLPVSPGTRHVTIGGAIANDVHGKNHHVAGTFGRHVPRFELLRSDGSRRVCSATENAELYAATIGGMGLTGLITWADLELIALANPFIVSEEIPIAGLDDFFAVDAESAHWPYTVAWIDALASGSDLGRGVFFRGEHASAAEQPGTIPATRSLLSVPFDFPSFALSKPTVQIFNAAYRFLHRRRRRQVVHFQPFFYPLDAVHGWNRIYGGRGFLQYQSVVPRQDARHTVAEMLRIIGESGSGSFLAVLKVFGGLTSPGLLSFPRPGVTLAVDFPVEGAQTFALCDKLDAVVRAAGGALYPAKDARMSREMFMSGFPHAERFARSVDPRLSSSFWRRAGVM